MKKITITVDQATMINLAILRYYYPCSSDSALIRKAISSLVDEAMQRYCDNHSASETADKYIDNHPELFGSGA